jgi:hypothetical protein
VVELPRSPEHIVQRSLETFNSHDLDAFLPLFADDVLILDLLDGSEILRGMAAFRDRYARAFAEDPEIHADLLGRIVMGSLVVDHESLRRAPNRAAEQALVVYEVDGGQITRMWFVEPPSRRRPAGSTSQGYR